MSNLSKRVAIALFALALVAIVVQFISLALKISILPKDDYILIYVPAILLGIMAYCFYIMGKLQDNDFPGQIDMGWRNFAEKHQLQYQDESASGTLKGQSVRLSVEYSSGGRALQSGGMSTSAVRGYLLEMQTSFSGQIDIESKYDRKATIAPVDGKTAELFANPDLAAFFNNPLFSRLKVGNNSIQLHYLIPDDFTQTRRLLRLAGIWPEIDNAAENEKTLELIFNSGLLASRILEQ